MRLRNSLKKQVCIFCAIKYGLEPLLTQPLQLTRFSRSYHASQYLLRPAIGELRAQFDDRTKRQYRQPRQQKLYERLRTSYPVRGGLIEDAFSSPPSGGISERDSSSRPPPKDSGSTNLLSTGQEARPSFGVSQNGGGSSLSSRLTQQNSILKHQNSPTQAGKADNNIDSSCNDNLRGSFTNTDGKSSNHESPSTQEADNETDSNHISSQELVHSTHKRPRLPSLSQMEHGPEMRSGETEPVPEIRRHWIQERLVRKLASGHYPSEPNSRYADQTYPSNLPSWERVSGSPSSGMSVLENWARDPRAVAVNNTEKLQDFESTNLGYARRQPKPSSTSTYGGRMSVLDTTPNRSYGNGHIASDPNSTFSGGSIKPQYPASAFGSAALAYQERKDEEARRANNPYNTNSDLVSRHRRSEQYAPDIAGQQNFESRHLRKNAIRSKLAREDSGFVNDENSRRTGERGGKTRSKRSTRRGAEDLEGYNKYNEDFDDAEGDDRRRKKKKKSAGKMRRELESFKRPIQLPEFITVERLSAAMNVDLGRFMKTLQDLGYESPAYDHILDYENSSLICQEFNFEPVAASQETSDLKARPLPNIETLASLPHRPPIVTIMGHVDHGKTTILDWLRKSSVAAAEHGGITQHIGAFSVKMPGSEKTITFLDTPGHAAFLEMRRRGANVTDIVVLVVAADDSVKPQTLEAIKHAQESKVAIIVAINKVDKEDGNIERVKQDLARHGIDVESFGGDTQAVPVSGKTGQGMVDLEEAIIAEAENLQTQVEFDGPAEGWVIESSMGAGGRLATVLVRRGTLSLGDVVVAGKAWSRIRCLRNDAGVLVNSAPPGTPVVVDGWREVPDAGAEVLQAESESQAKAVIESRVNTQELAEMAKDASAINAARREEAEARAQQKAWESEQEWSKLPTWRRPNDNVGWVESPSKDTSGPKRIDIIVKADVAGSVEAVVNAVSSIGNNEIATNVIDSGVGPVNESDIEYLSAAGVEGYIVSFNQQDDGGIVRRAEAAGVQVLSHTIIYKVTDDLTERLADKLPPVLTQKVQGEAEVGEVFTINAGRRDATKVAGCKVTNGLISRDRKVRILRKKEVIFTGKLESLRHLKKDVTEMRAGTECGMGFEGWNDFKVGDQIQSFDEKREKRRL